MNHGVFEAASWMHCRWNALFHRHYVDLGRPRVKLRIMFDITIQCIGTSQVLLLSLWVACSFHAFLNFSTFMFKGHSLA